MSKKLLIILVFVGVLLGVYLVFRVKPTSTQTPVATSEDTTGLIVSDITQEFAKKYNKDVSNIIVSVDTNTEKFAKGQIRFQDEFGGAIWFGTKVGESWILAADGQGPMECEIAESYSFPQNFVPECINTEGELIER